MPSMGNKKKDIKKIYSSFYNVCIVCSDWEYFLRREADKLVKTNKSRQCKKGGWQLVRTDESKEMWLV